MYHLQPIVRVGEAAVAEAEEGWDRGFEAREGNGIQVNAIRDNGCRKKGDGEKVQHDTFARATCSLAP